MRLKQGCGLAAFGFLFVTVACLVFVALAGAMVLTGEVPIYAPRVLLFEPGPGYPLRPTTPITLTFDQPMDPASVEAAFSLEPPATGSFRWNEEYTRLTFVPHSPGYQTGGVQTVRLEAGAKAGTIPRPIARTQQWQFTLPPLVKALTPSTYQQDSGPWPTFQATFHYPLDCEATLQTFTFTPEVTGRLTCDGQMVTFSPTLPLLPGTAYLAKLDNVFLEGDPWPRPGVSWKVETAAPLIVLNAIPLQGTSLLDLWTPVRLTFNRPVVPESAVEHLFLAPEGGTPLSGQVTWQDNGSTLLFQPEQPLIPNTQYHLTLEAGVRDRLGFELEQALIRSFSTMPMLDQVSPADGTSGVSLEEPIRISFTRPMDHASVEAGLSFSPTLEGKASWEGNALTFTPSTGLLPNTQYQALLSADVRDASGAPLAVSHLWSFTTQPLLLRANLISGLPLLALQQPLELTFALPMDRANVEAALTISPTTPGTWSWSQGDRVATFRPDPAWLPGTHYTVILGKQARSANGWQTLGQDRLMRFTTGVPEVRFGEGPNVQVMDAAQWRPFQFITRGASPLHFRLYSITPAQFLELYSSGLRGIGPQEPQIIDTTGLTPTVQWYEAPALLERTGYYYDRWQGAEAHIPDDVSPGFYILSTEPSAETQGQLLIVLTHHALVLKRSLLGSDSRAQTQIIAWDTELSSGAPVVSATVRLYDREGTLLAEGQTDADGLLALDLPGDPGPLLALSDKDGDLTVCGLNKEWSELEWWEWWIRPASRPPYTTYSYTDRPIYRPGQTVYFKDWLRADDDVSYTLPAPELPVTVRLRDARDNVAATQVLTPTAFGTVHGSFQLADEPMLGTWHLETEVEGTVTRHPLQVEEYRKPDYKVTVHTSQKSYVIGEPISITVEAAYYFDQPVVGADLSLLLYPVIEEYYEERGPYFDVPILERKGKTDTQGRWQIVVPSHTLFHAGYQGRREVLAVEATVTDESGQQVSSYQTIVMLWASQGISLLLEQHGYRPNKEIALTAIVRDRDGGPVAGTELTAQVLGWDEQEVTAATAATDGKGEAHFALRLTEQGWYQLVVRGRDDGGREMRAEEWLWVYDPDGQAPYYKEHWGKEPINVSADRTTYAIGDVAHLVIYSAVAGPALLTLERGKAHHAEPIELITGTNLITLPIQADYAPNIFVTVSRFGPSVAPDSWQTWAQAQLYTASTQLLVPMADRLLTVTLTPDRQSYAPGDQATFQVQVTDHQGRPVVAEVSLAVVDEALYALAEDLSHDPFEVFYAPRPDLVTTFDSMRPTRWLFPQGGLGEGGEVEAGVPRRTFLDTAYWAPAVVTDKNGRATIPFTLPDNLTEWRALARAVTTDTLVGQATAHLVVSQEIVVRPALPRFLVQGDAITLTATVHNFTAHPVSATVNLDLSHLQSPIANIQQIVHLPAGGSATVAWPVIAEEPGQAQVTIQATATYRGARLAGRDAVELSLPILPLAIPEVTTWAGDLTPSRPTATVTVTLPAEAIPELSRLEIHLAPSIAPGLLEGLESLIGYPYGCVEQTMSRVFPNAMVAQAFRKLGLHSELLEVELPPMVDQGLQRLYGFQHNDGGWGWWYDDNTAPYQTAYVLLGLAMTEQAGFDVDDGVMQRGAEALRRLLPQANPSIQAYGTYALAMAGQPFSVTLTLTDALKLDPFSQAALAVALDMAGDRKTVNALLDNLRESAVQDAIAVYWLGQEGLDSRKAMGSTVRTTAMVADALARLDPESPLLPKAVRWLMGRRTAQGWGDTQRTGFAILALSDYLLATREPGNIADFYIYVNDQLWQGGRLEQADAGQTLTVPLSALLPGENHLHLVLGTPGEEPKGRLYYAITLNTMQATDGAILPARQTSARSIGIRREYRLYGSKEPAAEFRRGDLVEVRLTLDVPEESWYVIVDDPLPAGFEALNERLGTTSHVARLYEEPVYYWEEYGYNRKEVHDERVTFFITHLQPGRRTITYLMRAMVAGDLFTVLPTQVYPMYEPEMWSRSESWKCRIGSR